MSKTHQFRITVATAKKTFKPGELVPVGGKEGVSPEEIKSIEATHGVWAGGDAPRGDERDTGKDKALAAVTGQLAERDKELAAMKAVIDAQAAVDAAAKAVDAENAPATAIEDLTSAEAALAAAKAAAGLAETVK